MFDLFLYPKSIFGKLEVCMSLPLNNEFILLIYFTNYRLTARKIFANK